MRILLIPCILSTLLIYSCQKEVDFAGANGINNGSVKLLQKLVSRSGFDSTTLIFAYNSSDKLMQLTTIDLSGGVKTTTSERAERNSQGIIQKLFIKDDEYRRFGLDSVITIVQYSGGKYLSKVTTIDVGIGVFFRDSVAISYDASGNVISENRYDDFAVGSYDETGKIDFTYTGKNIATVRQYAFNANTSSYVLNVAYVYDEYDNNSSPLSIGYDAFVFDSPSLYSSNNPTKYSITAPPSPARTYATAYTYSPENRPSTAVATIQPANSMVTSTYYYQ